MSPNNENTGKKIMNKHNELRLANDPETSHAILEELSRSPSDVIRGAVAFNKTTSPETLLRLVGDKSNHVIEMLQKNKIEFSDKNFIVSACKHINLRLATINDSEFILNLRLDTSLNEYVSEVNNDLKKQKQWILRYKGRERSRKEFYFIVESLQGYPYGTVRLYDFNGAAFCWGSWMIQRNSPMYVSIESVLSMYEFAFYTLGFNRAYFSVRKKNIKVVKFHEMFGAKHTSSDAQNYYFNFEKIDYEITKMRYMKFLV